MYLETNEEIMATAKTIADNVLEFGTLGNEYAQCELYVDNNFRLTDSCRLTMLGIMQDHINDRRYK